MFTYKIQNVIIQKLCDASPDNEVRAVIISRHCWIHLTSGNVLFRFFFLARSIEENPHPFFLFCRFISQVSAFSCYFLTRKPILVPLNDVQVQNVCVADDIEYALG